jgi:hypothetical protein
MDTTESLIVYHVNTNLFSDVHVGNLGPAEWGIALALHSSSMDQNEVRGQIVSAVVILRDFRFQCMHINANTTLHDPKHVDIQYIFPLKKNTLQFVYCK